ncbi:unnamed protein product [Blepharisma stoltei]|uniref:Mitochondrial cardiolipin hydrolase n=1 Tax=Blepharisma stoltei TaxID=1481888 RepID=A0AAU9KG49_9CILI|nr:unnamed protein product [Blepharisma stoltei]
MKSVSTPRKRAKHIDNEEYKPSKSEIIEANEHEQEEIANDNHVSSEEIYRYLRKNVGDMNSLKGLRKLVIESSCSRRLINSVISYIFDLTEKNPSAVEWGKKAVVLATSEVLEPKKRIREAFFFPSTESEQRLIKYLNKAKTKMLVSVFTITNDNLSNALRNARRRGVNVMIISDDECMKMNGSDIRALYEEGFSVRVDLNPFAHMHNKFVVIDDYLLITGSFNWTKQAVQKNQENLVVVDDSILAHLYTDEFFKLWEKFEPSEEKYFKKKIAQNIVYKESIENYEEKIESLPEQESYDYNLNNKSPAYELGMLQEIQDQAQKEEEIFEVKETQNSQIYEKGLKENVSPSESEVIQESKCVVF